MARASQHRYFHGVLIKGFCEHIGVDVNAQNIDTVKQMLKAHHHIKRVSTLTDAEYSQFINQVAITLATEFGFELESEKNIEMKDFLKLVYSNKDWD